MAKTHGMKKTKEWKTWSSMRERCLNTKHKHYHNYGGRGITICRRWDKFENFYEDMGVRPVGNYSLDRRDNSKGYTPSNCYWATKIEQGNNRRTNKLVKYMGREMTVAQWAREIGIRPLCIHRRMAAGWPMDIVMSPKRFRGGHHINTPWEAER